MSRPLFDRQAPNVPVLKRRVKDALAYWIWGVLEMHTQTMNDIDRLVLCLDLASLKLTLSNVLSWWWLPISGTAGQ